MLARKLKLSELPEGSTERKRALFDYFGELIFSLRRLALGILTRLLNSEEARRDHGRLKSKHYDLVASRTDPELNSAVTTISQDGIDYFVQMLLGYLDHTGKELEIDERHVARFRLVMEICDKETDQVVSELQLNRDDDVYFARSWGRWFRLNDETQGGPE